MHISLARQHLSIQNVVQNWPEVIFTLSYIEGFLGGKRLKGDEEVKDAVKFRWHGMAMEVRDENKENLVTGYDNSLNVGGEYIGK